MGVSPSFLLSQPWLTPKRLILTKIDMHSRWHIYFYGRVQGVGFRYTCQQTAAKYDVAGWVKNLPDRSVEMIVEGTTAELRNYVQDVCDSTHGRVDDRKITKSEATDEFDSMTIIR